MNTDEIPSFPSPATAARPVSAPPRQTEAAPSEPPKRPSHFTPEQRAQIKLEAGLLLECYVSSCLTTMLREEAIGRDGVKVALDMLLAQVGTITDPIERMLVEQFAVLHFRLVGFQALAVQMVQPESVKAYNGALARLQGESRRLALAIRQYRAPVAGKSFSVIHQQNVATAGGQQEVRYGDKARAGESAEEPQKNPFSAQAEMSGKDEGNLHELRERIARNHEPQACSGGADQRAQEAPLVR